VSRRATPLEPLRREPPGTGTPAARLGEVVRAVPEPPALGAAARARISSRLRDGAAPEAVSVDRRSWRMRPVVAIAVLVCLVPLGIGAQAAVAWMRRPGGVFGPQAPPALPESARPRRASPPHEGPRTPPAPVAEAAADPVVNAPPPSRRARPEARGPVAARAPEPSPLAHESRLLARAHEQLRTRRDYAGALATLDEYDRRFPAGALRSEATLARLDALVAIGKSAAALPLLDEATIRGPRALELLVLRGELRAAAGRHGEAIQDFDRVLARKPPAPLERRALYGRASSRSRLGDGAGAASDLEAYQTRFPAAPPR
jgi:hypothetical protein